MAFEHVFKLADKFADIAKNLTRMPTAVLPGNLDFKGQRLRFAEFYDMLKTKLRAIVGEMSGELKTLEVRGFDATMQELLNQTYHHLIAIYRDMEEDDPYAAGKALVEYALRKPHLSVLDNLDFLAKHHLSQTNADFGANSRMVNPQMRSLDRLKELATKAEQFMTLYPIIEPPTQTALQPSMRRNMEIVPDMRAKPEDQTAVRAPRKQPAAG